MHKTSVIPEKICPLAQIYTLVASFMPSPNHSIGLRYHGISHILSELYDQNPLKTRRAISVAQTEVFKAYRFAIRPPVARYENSRYATMTIYFRLYGASIRHRNEDMARGFIQQTRRKTVIGLSRFLSLGQRLSDEFLL